MTFYIAQGISVLTAVIAVLMLQSKSMKLILLGQITTNLLTALTYVLLGGFSGAGISIIAIVQSLVMFIYNQKKRKPHLILLIGFILAYVACSAFYYRSFIDIFSALAAVCFAISIAMEKPFLSRVWYSFNPFCWLVYDISTKAYGNLLIRVVVLISTAIAFVRVDHIFGLGKTKETKKADNE